ncbi:MAG: glycosyltransferase family 9 protein [Ignavibacteria bacterium]|nr:glycosyltransferase family 9 protein [Ignavibacteria bacterium]
MQNRILIVRTDRVGDVIMITPMIREIRRTFPDAFIATLTNPNSADVLINNPNVNEIITDDLMKDSFSEVTAKLRSFKFSDGLLVMPTERAAYQMFLAGVKNRIGVGRKLYEVITFMKSVSRNKYIPLRHEADYCMDLARVIGVSSDNLTPEIFLTPEEKELRLNSLIASGSRINTRKIIIHTGSGGSSRNWSEEKYLKLIESILNRDQNSEIILTAKEMTDDFVVKAKAMSNELILDVRDLVIRLRDLINIISNCDLLIAASTGPLHVASALGIKTIGLYCHRPMNCSRHWGALGMNAVNLEISKSYCDASCSDDKENCNFENGLGIDNVINFLN